MEAKGDAVSEPRNSIVYFIKDEVTSLIKIGYTTNIVRRFSALSTGMPGRLSIIRILFGTSLCEKEFHEVFAADRVSGEWFSFNPKMLLVQPARGEGYRSTVLAGGDDIASEMLEIVIKIASPRGANESADSFVRRAAVLLGFSYRRVRGFWYRESRKITADELKEARAALERIGKGSDA